MRSDLVVVLAPSRNRCATDIATSGGATESVREFEMRIEIWFRIKPMQLYLLSRWHGLSPARDSDTERAWTPKASAARWTCRASAQSRAFRS
jgi:hypothetical protein